MKRESDLYPPVKAFLEGQGYEVKGEIKGCDLVAVRGQEPPVIVELKKSFGLGIVLQGVDRLALSEQVYLAVGEWPKRMRDVRKLCRRVGLGFMVIHKNCVEVILDPEPYRPRLNKRRTARLLGEHARRVGDPTRGGSTRIPIMTAYRQEALRCAEFVAAHGSATLRELRSDADAPNAAKILQRNVYGWFDRVARGAYALTEAGRRDLQRFAARQPTRTTTSTT
jgi:hypothetical protein